MLPQKVSLSHSNRDSLLPSTSKNGSAVQGSKPGPVTCSMCGKSFSRQSVLNVHSQMVHGAASSIKSLNKSNSILAHVKQSVVVPSVATAGAAMSTDSTSVGSNFEAQFSLRSFLKVFA